MTKKVLDTRGKTLNTQCQVTSVSLCTVHKFRRWPERTLEGHPGHKCNSLDKTSVRTPPSPKYQRVQKSVGWTTKNADGQNSPTPRKQLAKHKHQWQRIACGCAQTGGHQSARYLDLTASIETLTWRWFPCLRGENRIATFRQRNVHNNPYIRLITYKLMQNSLLLKLAERLI